MAAVTDPPLFADQARRVFIFESRDGSYLHIVHPVDPADHRVADGVTAAGMLVCECAGGRYRGSCYQVGKAEQLLRAAGQSVVGWIGPAPDKAPTSSGYPEDSAQWPAPAGPARGDDFEVVP